MTATDSAMTCEYPLPYGFCGEQSFETVGVDFTPYCPLHVAEMRAREEAST